MKSDADGQLLRIYVSESDRWEGRPLYEAIVRTAREHGLAGATALRGIEGFGAKNRVHTVRVLHLSEHLPIVIEIIDRADRIAAFRPTIDKMLAEGLVTVHPVTLTVYRREAGDEAAEDELQLESQEFIPPPVTAPAPVRFDRAAEILEVARKSASASRRVYVDSVDVLLAMLRESKGIAGRVLAGMRIDVDTVEQCLQDAVSRDEPSAAYITALNARSAAESKWLEHDHVGTEHLLMALCEIRPSAATDILMRLGAQPRDICKEVLKIMGNQDDWQRWLADHPDM
jgi:PII-like signaling protein